MPEPVASEAAAELYEALSPAFTQEDEANDWAVLRFCIALTSGNTSLIHDWVTDQPDGSPGWQILLNPAEAPAVVLPWLAQFSGAVLKPEMDEEAQRNTIKNPEAFGRGTPAAIEAVAKRRLTGSKTVILTERYTGKAWRLRVETLEAETPEPVETEADIRAEQKPIGIVLFFNERIAWDWGEVRAEATTDTWLEVRTLYATWALFRTHEP